MEVQLTITDNKEELHVHAFAKGGRIKSGSMYELEALFGRDSSAVS